MLVPHVVEINPGSCNWEQDRPSLHHWMEPVFSQWGADRQSIGALVRLSQHSIHGYEEANSIVWKLVKKRADYDRVKKYSAFVKTCVDNAWLKLRTLGNRLR